MRLLSFHLKTLIKYLLLPLGFLYELFRVNKDEILILMYHRVIEGVNKELALSPDMFKRQMDYLYKKRYRVITMDRAYTIIRDGTIKGKYVVITFDDGYMDFYHNTYPILKGYGFPSIMYLCPDYIGAHRKYCWDEDEREAEIMGWGEILNLRKEGMVDFGSHTMDHRDMDNLSIEETIKQLSLSKEILEKKLGLGIKHFAYPRGIYSPMGETAIKDYYDTGVLTSNGRRVDRNCGMDSVYRLKRIPVLKSDKFYLFIARLKGWLIVEELIRRYLLG